MRVLICPDKFAGTLSAVQAAAAISAGWSAVASDDVVTCLPLADGGPGFVDVVHAAVGGQRVEVATVDPLGRPVLGWVLLVGSTAYVESAQACGLQLIEAAHRDPKITTSYGVGLLIQAAAAAGGRTIVVGLGGSATNDGGAGLLAALGAVPVDAAGAALPGGGAALMSCAGLGAVPRLRDVTLVAATDVDAPLTGLFGASAVFGPQKGASRADVLLLDQALERFAAVLERDLPSCPPRLAGLPGAGSAGGLGAALLACGARTESGVGLVRRLCGWEAALAQSDLVITGEGTFDDQSLRGKVVGPVAAAARDLGVPCVVLAGQVEAGRRGALAAGVVEAYSLVDYFGSVAAALDQPVVGLRALAGRLAGQWSRARS